MVMIDVSDLRAGSNLVRMGELRDRMWARSLTLHLLLQVINNESGRTPQKGGIRECEAFWRVVLRGSDNKNKE